MEDCRVIVLDEQLKNASVAEQISQWYHGRVVHITALRPATVIKDDAIPILLRQVVAPTFVTINTTDCAILSRVSNQALPISLAGKVTFCFSLIKIAMRFPNVCHSSIQPTRKKTF